MGVELTGPWRAGENERSISAPLPDAMATIAPFDDFTLPPFPVRRFTVEEYRRLGETGVLAEEDRVELLEGWIVPKMIHHPPHDAAVELAQAALQGRLPTGYRLRIQSAISTPDSEPEPDLAVVSGSIRDHVQRHPAPHEIALVVEVAASSLDLDRAKARLYARAGIAVYWIVNLAERRVEVYEDPTGPAPEPVYRRESVYLIGDAVPISIAGAAAENISVRDLLP
jgi:Uma2 family endonuclease